MDTPHTGQPVALQTETSRCVRAHRR